MVCFKFKCSYQCLSLFPVVNYFFNLMKVFQLLVKKSSERNLKLNFRENQAPNKTLLNVLPTVNKLTVNKPSEKGQMKNRLEN